MICEYCKTYGSEDKYHKGTCANCGAPLKKIAYDEEPQTFYSTCVVNTVTRVASNDYTIEI